MALITYLFRKKNPRFYSIEKVFEPILPLIGNEYVVAKLVAPRFSNGFASIFNNIFYFFRKCLRMRICHITGDIHYVAIGLASKNIILTIHDLVFITRAYGLKKFIFKWLFIKLPVRLSAVVTTISEKSKAEIVENSRCDPDKIIVIPNPVSESIFYRDKMFCKSCPVLLFIGTTENKNLFRVVEAIKDIECLLVIIGQLSFEQESKLKGFNVNYSSLYGLTDQEIAEQYATSDIVLFPSIYEGFGMPIIEGQKAGRTVITSNLSPMKEVAGEGACLINPFDSNDLRNGILKVLNDDHYRTTLIEKGFENVKKYSPLNIARQYIAIYKKFLSCKNEE